MRHALRSALASLCLALASTSHAQSAPVANVMKLTVASSDGNLVNAAARDLSAQHYDVALTVTQIEPEPAVGSVADPHFTYSVTGTRKGEFTGEQVHAAQAQCTNYAKHAGVTCKSETTLQLR
jgi:hypothetical protein